jgi:hypothetical protein
MVILVCLAFMAAYFDHHAATAEIDDTAARRKIAQAVTTRFFPGPLPTSGSHPCPGNRGPSACNGGHCGGHRGHYDGIHRSLLLDFAGVAMMATRLAW